MSNLPQNSNNNLSIAISTMAKALNVHQRTLRIYDKKGILKPERTKKNRRCYSLPDLEKGKLILFLTRNLGINLAGVRIIISLLEKYNTAPKNYIKIINEIAENEGINEDIQTDIINKMLKRGRRKKHDL